MSHGNAPLTPHGRLRLARCVVDDGWPLRRAAAAVRGLGHYGPALVEAVPPGGPGGDG